MEFPSGDTPQPLPAETHRSGPQPQNVANSVTRLDSLAFAKAAPAPRAGDPSSEFSRPQHAAGESAHLASLTLGLFAMHLGSTARDLRGAMNERLAEVQLGEVDFLLLCLLANQPRGELLQSALTAELPCSPPRISKAVETLRAAEWLVATRDPLDRRRQTLCLTEAGSHQLARASAAIQPLLVHARSVEDRARLTAWTAELERLQDGIRRESLQATQPRPAERSWQEDAA